MEKVTREKEKAQRDLEIQLRQLGLDLVEAQAEIEMVTVEASVPPELVPALELAQTRLRAQLARKRAAFLEDKMRFQEELVHSKLELLEVKKTRTQQKIAYYSDARDRFEVKAPIDGVVLYVPKPNGQRWEVGEGVWMLAKILKVADISTLQVQAQVLEVDAARVAVGQPAEIVVDALPGQTIVSQVGEVGRIVHARSPQDPSKVFDAFLPLDDVDIESMRPGMSVRVAVEIQRLPGSVTVPLQAIRAGPEGTYVNVVDASGRGQPRVVELGPRSRDRVVVRTGLAAGERVLLAGADAT
jgi:HlyD family secretion protein